MASPSDSASPMRKVYTYHCICSHLILATTQQLSSLTCRAAHDKSHVLPLPPLPADEASNHISNEYAILLGTILERNPIVIRSTEGFEKRYLQRCGRCRLPIGYQLDKSQYEDMDQSGRREDVLYLLPGGLVDTEEMVAGTNISPLTALEAHAAPPAEVT